MDSAAAELGTFLLFAWLMMMGLSLVVYPQWRENERMPFPLLNVYDRLTEPPAAGSYVGRTVRSRLFVVAALVVFTLHSLWIVHSNWPELVPAIPLNWDRRHAVHRCVHASAWPETLG